jgi:hypothetical protein
LDAAEIDIGEIPIGLIAEEGVIVGATIAPSFFGTPPANGDGSAVIVRVAITAMVALEGVFRVVNVAIVGGAIVAWADDALSHEPVEEFLGPPARAGVLPNSFDVVFEFHNKFLSCWVITSERD